MARSWSRSPGMRHAVARRVPLSMQIACWSEQPRFPDWRAAARHQDRAARVGLLLFRSGAEGLRAKAARVLGYWGQSRHSLVATLSGRLRHCDGRCCRVRPAPDYVGRLLRSAHITAPEIRSKVRAVPPARTLRESRVIFGRSAPRRKGCALSAERCCSVEGAMLSFALLSVTITSRRS